MALTKKNRGITLVEVLFTITMMMILFAVIPRVFMQLNNSMMSASNLMSSNENARNASQLAVRLLSAAKASSVILTAEAGEAPYSEIKFKTILNESDAIFQRNGDLVHNNNGAEHVLLKGGIKRIAFVYPDLSDVLTVQMTVTSMNNNSTGGKRTLGTATKIIHFENK